jgi:hypothetical protein
MRKQTHLLLFFTAAAFILLTGFKRDSLISAFAASNPGKGPVTITAVYDFSTFPDVFGTFTASGAINASGTTEMVISGNQNGVIAHCIVTLTAPNGTITIHQRCEFSTNPPKGQWNVISGTGAYANLKANGSLLMPPNTEAMEGTVY